MGIQAKLTMFTNVGQVRSFLAFLEEGDLDIELGKLCDEFFPFFLNLLQLLRSFSLRCFLMCCQVISFLDILNKLFSHHAPSCSRDLELFFPVFVFEEPWCIECMVEL